MNSETIILVILCGVYRSYSILIQENKNDIIFHSYEELTVKKLSHKLLFHTYNIYDTRLDIGKNDPQFTICQDKQDNLIYLQAKDATINKKSLGLFMINLRNLKFYKIIIKLGQDGLSVNFSRLWCSFRGFYGYDEKTDLIIMKINEENAVKAFHLHDKLENVYLDESKKHHLALVTKSQGLLLYEFKKQNWKLVSSNVSNPKWFNKGNLFFVYNNNQLKSYSLTTHKTTLHEPNMIQYNIIKNIVWVHQAYEHDFKMKFFISGKWHDEVIDNVVHNQTVQEVFISNNLIYILTKRTNNINLIYEGNRKKLIFYEIDADLLDYIKNHVDGKRYLHLLDGLPGVMMLTKTIRYLGNEETLKTIISYNGGKTWSYLKLKNKENTPCESAKCEISILPGENSLSSVLKYSSINPLVIVAPCTITKNNILHGTILMVSEDGGFSWIYPEFNFSSIDILNQGEILVGIKDDTDLYVSVDNGLIFLKLNILNTNHTIIKIITGTAYKYKVAMISKNKTSEYYHLSILDLSGILNHECHISDYDIYTPGSQIRHQCFMGRRGYSVNKKPLSVCMISDANRPNISTQTCVCEPEDYICNPKYESIDEKCYVEDYLLSDWYDGVCTSPNQFIKSLNIAKKSHGNICVDHSLKYKELEICLYQFNYDTVSLLVNNKLFFYNILQESKNIYEFPLELQNIGRIYDVEVDKHSKCIYGLFKDGIFRKCYKSQNDLDKKFELVVHDSNIVGMDIDPRTTHLYYHDKKSITVLHSRFFTRMTIFQTEHLIYFVKLDVNTE
ncbi:Vacuolar protein sorting/targeting protein 10 [Thelohanellus kitauei]|uniref:Vacuolar protein sorting/targeting protein 10 n=1 Tax=Thelohanellus kitauei TaxID=669202 RepID=A0A0C2J417_THEKT|nr:Vacuolar protein sorting/targeting protein 10 [Thelohanellus kitauei]